MTDIRETGEVAPATANDWPTRVRAILPPVVRSLARRTARRLRHAGRLVDRRALSRQELIEELERLGITRNATVYLHTSMDEFRRRVPSVAPVELVALLKSLIGPNGNLLVPTFPFTGSQHAYALGHRVFDVRRTVSKVGLFSEIFRRSDGVTRSWHPTHAIAAWGRNSRDLVSEHHLGTAFGRLSPVYKLQEYDGLVAGIGVTPERCFTVYHVAEELHPATYAAQYGEESIEMTIEHGRERIPYTLRPLRPGGRRYMSDSLLVREGILRSYRVKGLRLSSARVSEFLRRAAELIDANLFYMPSTGNPADHHRVRLTS